MLPEEVIAASNTAPHLDITKKEVLQLILHVKAQNSAEFKYPYAYIAGKLADLKAPNPLLPKIQLEK